MIRRRSKFALGALGLFLLAATPSADAAEALQFTVDPTWPKTLPNNWILGEIGGMATDAQNNVWVLQRPRSLTDDEKGAALNPPRSKCCMPAPSVIQFDSAGNVKSAWGGPGQGYQWPEREHALRLDNKGNVYLSGNGPKDQMLVKFTTDGKFVKQFGRLVDPLGSKDTTAVGRPADIFYDQASNELYIADGYGNHRVLVIDADTFAFKRMWGAYGRPPEDPMPRVEPAPPPNPGARRARQSPADRAISAALTGRSGSAAVPASRPTADRGRPASAVCPACPHSPARV